MMKLVEGTEMPNELVPHPRLAVENQEGYLSYRGSPITSEGSQSHIKLLSPEHQCQEETL